MDEILRYFPNKIYQIFSNLLQENPKVANELQEIRIRVDKPIILKLREKDLILQYNILQTEILQIVERLCENSIYAYKNQICEGFITIKGGHRIGLTGNVVMEEQKIVNINYISSLNFRIARQKIDCSKKLLRYVINIEKNNIYNTLIISPPGCGKTTILRDLIRTISNGIKEINFKR